VNRLVVDDLGAHLLAGVAPQRRRGLALLDQASGLDRDGLASSGWADVGGVGAGTGQRDKGADPLRDLLAPRERVDERPGRGEEVGHGDLAVGLDGLDERAQVLGDEARPLAVDVA